MGKICNIYPYIDSGEIDKDGYLEQIRICDTNDIDFLSRYKNGNIPIIKAGFAILIDGEPWNGHRNKATSNTVTWVYDKPENSYQILHAVCQLLELNNETISVSFWDYSEAKFIRKDTKLHIVDFGLNSIESPEFSEVEVDFLQFTTSIIACAYELQSFVEKLLLNSEGDEQLTRRIRSDFSVEIQRELNRKIIEKYLFYLKQKNKNAISD